MSQSHVGVFETTIEKTHHWLEDIRSEMGWEGHEKAYSTLRAVLHALRDRVHPNEAVDLAAQLPMLVRGFYFDGWHPANKPLKYRTKQEFLDQVQKEAPSISSDEVERSVTAVLHQVSIETSGGEANQLRDQLPEEVRALWAQSAL